MEQSSKDRLTQRRQKTGIPGLRTFEAEVLPGLEAFASQELRRRYADLVVLPTDAGQTGTGRVPFRFLGPLETLAGLSTIQAIYALRHFDIPRPRALLGDANFRSVVKTIRAVAALSPPGTFQTLHLSAAGSGSSTLTRFMDRLATELGMTIGEREGDLLLRLRRPPSGGPGWELLVRLTPRPLATRAWRVCNWEGGLVATAANVMGQLSGPGPGDTFLNLACGSGSIMIERLALMPARLVIGVDPDGEALACASKNLRASSSESNVALVRGDGQHLPMPSGSVDALVADLPFGGLVGSHKENVILYPAVLKEAARVARPGARFVVLTHEIRLLQASLAQEPSWRLESSLRINLRGLHPRIFVLICKGRESGPN